MKKFLLYAMLALCLIFSAGCNKKDKVITADKVKNNTILVKNDGSVQDAIVEAFDKDYYSLDELKSFAMEQIDKYNQANGENSIVMDSLDLSDGNAVLILSYSSLDHYNAFNKAETILTTTADALRSDLKLPDAYLSAKDGSYVSPDVALKNEKYMVLILNEKTNVIVDGTIKFFANGKMNGKSDFETGSEEQSVIIYKP
ncbi:MAG: Lipoprotein [Lachnoclostridium sp.]